MNLRPAFNRIALLAALAGWLCCGGLFAESASDSISAEILGVFNRGKAAIVKIEAVDEHGMLCGTGFFIDPNGTIYTTYTVGGESHDIVVSYGDRKFTATRLVADSRSGIAILKVEAQTPYLPLGKSDSLAMASPVMTIGYPMDFPITFNFGIVGGFNIKYYDRYFTTMHIRANVPVQRGEGGSPLLNMKGEVMGVLISAIDDGGGCFVLPIEAAEKVRSDFMRFGEVRPGWLGIGLQDVKNPVEGSIAQINQLIEGAPGEKGGLKKGDFLIGVGGRKINSLCDMLSAAFFFTSGDKVPVTIMRGTEKITVNLQAMDHPSIHHEIADTPQQGIPLAPPPR